jgi:hypothetical protein
VELGKFLSFRGGAAFTARCGSRGVAWCSGFKGWLGLFIHDLLKGMKSWGFEADKVG